MKPLFFCLILFATSQAFAKRSPSVELSKAEAMYRSSLVSDVNYVLHFNLYSSENEFSGKSTLNFNLRKLPPKPLTVDFSEGEILSVSINGQTTKPNYNKSFLTLDSKPLKMGSNKVEIEFRHSYSRNGSGLYRFKDPEDGKSYVYSDFEPYDANRLFPSFDQPDLKATYEMTVDAPNDWQVISSRRESRIENKEGFKSWIFPKSLPFSTYIFSLHAGNYQVFEDKNFRIPLRVFVRASLASYVDAKEWFNWSRAGFDYFEKYFGFKYPFEKYDQIIVPDFNSGAMENVAAVTFSERFVKRYKPTKHDRQRHAYVLLHEMAHMWFGNIVTMKWWDDLWLNESFATLMAYFALVEATEFKDAWVDFYLDTKLWAYMVDITPTTHPISTSVANTSVAFSNFDGITYGKGASVLKLLNYYLGPENFEKGVQKFVNEYQYKNATFKEFIVSLSEAAGTPLRKWTREWFETAGVNSFELKYSCQSGKIEKVTLKQGFSSGAKQARPHKMQLALFDKTEKGLSLRKPYEVTYDKNQQSLKELAGEPCPDFIFANYNDHDYTRVLYEAADKEKLKTILNQTEDQLVRSMVWGALWDMVHETRLSPFEFGDLILSHIEKETDINLIKFMLDRYVLRWEGSWSVLYFATYAKDKKHLRHFSDEMEKKLWSLLNSTMPSVDHKLMYFDYLLRLTESPESRDKLKALLSGDLSISGFSLDQDRRWDVIKRLAEFSTPGLNSIINSETNRDKSDKARKALLAIEAIQPSLDTKKKWLERVYKKDETLSFSEVKSVVWNLLPVSQRKFREELADTYFREIPKIMNHSDFAYVENLVENLAPIECSKSNSQRLRSLSQGRSINPSIKRTLVDLIYWEDKCERIRNFSNGVASR